MTRTRAAALLLLALAGCTRTAPIPTSPGGNTGGGAGGDPWPAAVAELRKPLVELGTCQRVLNQLTADLSGTTSAPAPAPMPADAAGKLAELLRLNPEEVREVRGGAFTGLDAAYLADALYLRDAARSLDVQGLPADRQAAAAFAWACRQAYPRTWEVPNPEGGTMYAPPLPPTVVLKRGFGTGLERAYLFLAVLQQLGLDGCLVGPPGQEQGVTQKIVDGGLGKGPFWAVGVAAGGDVFLFDPWRGAAVPGPAGPGVGTLSQLKKNPDQVKPWREDKDNPWAVPPADVAGAVAYVTVPLSAVSTRMKLLEAQLAAAVGVKLAADPKELIDRVARAGVPVAVWAPPSDAFTYTRVLSSYLPRSAGGLLAADLNLPGQLIPVLVPPFRDARPAGLKPDEAAQLLANRLRDDYATAFYLPRLLERIHRGYFNEAARGLVEAEKPYAAAEQRSRSDAQAAAVREWVGKANETYQQLSRARLPENAGLRPEAEAAVAQFWKAEGAGALAVIDRAGAAAGRAEAAYLTAVCKHEQAERAQLRFERAARAGTAPGAATAARAGWDAAKDAWERYAPYAAGQADWHPGRAGHARQLSARSARLAADPAADL